MKKLYALAAILALAMLVAGALDAPAAGSLLFVVGMPIIEGTKKLKHSRYSYDFAVDGGGIGTIPLRSNDGPIPAGAIVEDGYVDVTTLPTSGGAATIAGQVEAAGDLWAATGIASFVAASRRNILPRRASGSVSAAADVKTTAQRTPAIVVAAAALTAGKFDLVLVWR